jgi:hypothetical protein
MVASQEVVAEVACQPYWECHSSVALVEDVEEEMAELVGDLGGDQVPQLVFEAPREH